MIAEEFQKGFRKNSKLEYKRFVQSYESKFGTGLSLQREELEKIISNASIEIDGAFFLIEMLLSLDEAVRLDEWIQNKFDKEVKVIYYDTLLCELKDELAFEKLNNIDLLKAYLENRYKGNYYFYKNYFSQFIVTDKDPKTEIRKLLIEHYSPMNFSEISNALSTISPDKLQQVINLNGEFVSEGDKNYFYFNCVEFTDYEFLEIQRIIEFSIKKKAFITGTELIDSITQKFPEMRERNAAFSDFGLRNVLAYRLKNEFAFNGNLISQKGTLLTMPIVFDNYSETHTQFTLDDIKELANELNAPLSQQNFEALLEDSVRISADEFVSDRSILFTPRETDTLLEQICTEEYLSVKEITHFDILPSCGYNWNGFLLESYLSKYSRKFKLINNSFSTTDYSGAMVKKDSKIKGFDDLIVDVLKKEKRNLSEGEALNILVEKGYLLRRRYKGIKRVLRQIEA